MWIIPIVICLLACGFNLYAARALDKRPTLKRLPRVDSPVTVELERLESIPSVAEHPARVVGEDVELNTRERGWMQTHSGRRFYPLDPRPEDVELADVAHGLAMTCRYGGQCRMFYSVAEHCVLVSELVEMHMRNAGCASDQIRWFAGLALMHDSAEAYIGDMIRPLKHQPEMSEFRLAETRIEAAIAAAFKLRWTPEAHEIVKRIDDRILVDEITHLMPNPEMYLESPLLRGQSPLGARFRCMPPAEAKGAFMARWREVFR